MIIDNHVHVCAFTPEHGQTSAKLLKSPTFKFMRWRLGLKQEPDAAGEQELAELLARTIDESDLDAAVVLAFDAVHDHAGQIDLANTHLYVTNNYVIDLAEKHPKIKFGASVHPYRSDAVAEIERCVKAGAVLLKWLPIVQDFNPADPKCIPVYEVLAHFKLPLLCHTGGEKSLPQPAPWTADPKLLKPALDRGVTVIMAHCGTKSFATETDFLPDFVRLAKNYENCYGDTAALNLPTRWYAYRTILEDPRMREKLVHGSDWPIPPLAHPLELPLRAGWRLMHVKNWIQRDILIKREFGFDDDYFHRGAKLLGLRS